MRTNKIDDCTYTKELDEMESYFLNMFKKFIENDNNFLQESVDAIITESLARAKKEILREIENSKVFKPKTIVCTSDMRPTNPKESDPPCFDKTLNIPIWWNGSNWVDANGNNV